MGQQRYVEAARAGLSELLPEKYPPSETDDQSLRTLAKQAAEIFYGGEQGYEERLRKKFSAQESIWTAHAAYSDDVAQVIDLQILLKLHCLLERIGISMNLDNIER